MAGWRRISHDALRAAGVGAPRRAGVGVAVQARRQVITTLPYRAVSVAASRRPSSGSFITPPPILPTQTRYFWNTSRQDENMASATSFFDFKPKDSTSAPILSHPHTRRELFPQRSHHISHPLFLQPILSPPLTTPQSAARTTPSRSSLTKSSSSSTPPPSAASPLNSPGLRNSTRT